MRVSIGAGILSRNSGESMSSRATTSKNLPATIKPMLARLARNPFDSPNHIFELKWDGIRALAYVESGRIRFGNRNARDITSQFAELAGLPKQVNASQAVLDGELVSLDEQGRPSFALMQNRSQLAGGRSIRRTPAHYIAFDLLQLNGRSVMGEPLADRKNLLHEILQPSDLVQACEFIDTDGKAFFYATCELGLEGIVAKEKKSLYSPGKRSSSWLKIKRVRDSEFVIGGYAFGGKRKEPFSALLLGLHNEKGRLVYVGQVGTGFSQAEAKGLYSTLQGLHNSRCPFKEAPDIQKFIYWCRPEVVCQVRYGEFTLDGKLRYPVYEALREDKAASDCIMVDAPGWPQQLD